MPLARPLYRARQVFVALFPRLTESDLEEARRVLSEGEYALFRRMEARDQRHGIEVMRRLLAAGFADRDALAAALLHDCGKGWVPVWLRIEYVRNPARVEGLARNAAAAEDGASLEARVMTERSTAMAAYRLVHHQRLGADLARAAGASDATVRLISGIVGSDAEAAALAVLKAADDES